jgi:hypothetical protein
VSYVSRDPFARQELHKERVDVTPSSPDSTKVTCDFCASVKTGYRKNKSMHYLFKFRVENDGGSTNEIKGLFCSTECMKRYHS